MAPFVASLMKAAAEAFPLPAPVVQLGAYRGAADTPNLRDLFPGRPFLGVDARPGRGVDLVATGESLPFADRSVGVFIALNALQHVRRFWLAFEQMQRVLRPDGVAVVCAPFQSRLNPSPSDYWRFAPDAFDLMLQDFPQRVLGSNGPAKRPLHVWALAFGRHYPPVSAGQLAHFRRCLDRQVAAPAGWGQRLRFGLARLAAGRGPTQSWFDRNRWEMEYRGPDTACALAA